MYEISKDYGCMLLDLMELFGGMPIEKWRFNNVHFAKYGNTYLARAILDMIFPGGGKYGKELIDADLWFNRH